MRLVMFDLDNTLLAGDSDTEWPRFLIRKGLVEADRHHEANERFHRDYKAGILDIEAFLRFQLAPLTRYTPEQWTPLHQEFMREHILPIITDKSRALVKQHQDAGDLLLMITATNRFITGPIAEAFQISELIAVEVETKEGVYTGRPVGVPSYREGKIIRLDMWLQEKEFSWQDFTETWFYSDSFNDLPLLKRVSNPVAVDPDDILQAYAMSHGWPIISLR